MTTKFAYTYEIMLARKNDTIDRLIKLLHEALKELDYYQAEDIIDELESIKEEMISDE